MSAAFASSSAAPFPAEQPHLPHTAHPIPLREQAFTLHCQGLRSPAIARQLAVPQRTIRAWVAAALAELKEDQAYSRREHLLIAVERQHALTAAAWQQFEAETAVRAALLDAALAASLTPASTPAHAPDGAARLPRLPASTPAPRYLHLILQAHKETHRLLGLYALARLQLLTPDEPPAPPAPEPAASPVESPTPPADRDATAEPVDAPSSASAPAPDSEAQSATSPIPSAPAAESATSPTMTANAAAPVTLDPQSPAASATGAADTEPDLAAESATATSPRSLNRPSGDTGGPPITDGVWITSMRLPVAAIPATGPPTRVPQAATYQPVLSHGGESSPGTPQ